MHHVLYEEGSNGKTNKTTSNVHVWLEKILLKFYISLIHCFQSLFNKIKNDLYLPN